MFANYYLMIRSVIRLSSNVDEQWLSTGDRLTWLFIQRHRSPLLYVSKSAVSRFPFWSSALNFAFYLPSTAVLKCFVFVFIWQTMYLHFILRVSSNDMSLCAKLSSLSFVILSLKLIFPILSTQYISNDSVLFSKFLIESMLSSHR